MTCAAMALETAELRGGGSPKAKIKIAAGGGGLRRHTGSAVACRLQRSGFLRSRGSAAGK